MAKEDVMKYLEQAEKTQEKAKIKKLPKGEELTRLETEIVGESKAKRVLRKLGKYSGEGAVAFSAGFKEGTVYLKKKLEEEKAKKEAMEKKYGKVKGKEKVGLLSREGYRYSMWPEIKKEIKKRKKHKHKKHVKHKHRRAGYVLQTYTTPQYGMPYGFAPQRREIVVRSKADIEKLKKMI